MPAPAKPPAAGEPLSRRAARPRLAKPPPPVPPPPRRAAKLAPVKPPARDSLAPRRATKPAPRRSEAPEPAARATPSWQSCRIELWEGATRKQFYAEVPGGGGRVGQSPFFRVEEGQALEDSEQATEAFEALIDELIAGGWEITGRTGGWQLLLRRQTGADRQPVE
jgi:hypothetical protein